jgi:ribosomal protein L11 methyltransferase
VPPESAEAIEYFFNEIDSLGTEINNLRRSNVETVTVVGYFDAPPNADKFEEQLDLALKAYGLRRGDVVSITEREVENADWLSEWKQHWRPTRVGRFLIAPSWEDTSGERDAIVIEIEPNMAFGTGSHETTKLCLKAIEKYYRAGMSFLDVGTGTGILAIAAAKLNPSTVGVRMLALDTDADSIMIARENAKQNNLGSAIEFTQGSLRESIPGYDFVCANLTLDVIQPILPLLVKKAGRFLVLSGILAEQKEQLEGELGRLHPAGGEIEQDGEWISVLVRR